MKRWFAERWLAPLVARDYVFREIGQRPDRIFWADELLMRWGYWDLLPDTWPTPSVKTKVG